MLDIPHEAKVSIFAHTRTRSRVPSLSLSLWSALFECSVARTGSAVSNSPENATIFAGFLPPPNLPLSILVAGCCTSDWNPLWGAALFIRLTFKWPSRHKYTQTHTHTYTCQPAVCTQRVCVWAIFWGSLRNFVAVLFYICHTFLVLLFWSVIS